MRSVIWLVRAAALYNILGALGFLVPGMLDALHVKEPDSAFWLWLPALMGTFAAIVLLLSSMDLRTYAAFPYWNGIVRLIFAIVVFGFGFGQELGAFVTFLAIGDVLLALACIIGIPRAVGRTHRQLLTNT